MSTTGLEVFAGIAFKQPLSLPEISGYFTSDKRPVVYRLQHMDLVDCRKASETACTVWMTPENSSAALTCCRQQISTVS